MLLKKIQGWALAIVLSVLAFFAATTFVEANPRCVPADKAKEILAVAKMEEAFRAITDSGLLVQVYINPDGRFFIIGTRPDLSESCLVTQGHSASVFPIGELG